RLNPQILFQNGNASGPVQVNILLQLTAGPWLHGNDRVSTSPNREEDAEFTVARADINNPARMTGSPLNISVGFSFPQTYLELHVIPGDANNLDPAKQP